jgi:hypothetical protein
MVNMKTIDKLRAAALALVDGETERDPVPAAIESMCRARQGKQVLDKHLDGIRAQFPGLYLTRTKDKNSGEIKIDWWVRPLTSNVWDAKQRKHVEVIDEPTKEWDPKRAADQRAAIELVRRGVPQFNRAWGIVVRRGDWASPPAGPAYWPTVEELREWNPQHYKFREERNAARESGRAKLETSATDLEKIATLVDELNLIAGELRAYLTDDATPSELSRTVEDALTVALSKKEER